MDMRLFWRKGLWGGVFHYHCKTKGEVHESEVAALIEAESNMLTDTLRARAGAHFGLTVFSPTWWSSLSDSRDSIAWTRLQCLEYLLHLDIR